MTESKRVAVVTGGSRGIGKAIVDLFKDQGYAVVSCSKDQGSEAFQGSRADLNLGCDVADAAQVRGAVGAAIARFGRIDVLVNNAGLSATNPLDTGSDDDLWHEILAVNLSGTYYFSKHALPHMRGGGRILNIASTLALVGVPDQTAYCAAKHGVLGFTRALAKFVAPRGITVNAICPGWTRTQMAAQRARELGLSESDIAAGIPLGRMVDPMEVARFALYLSSPDASMITGQALTIDGGSIG